MRGLRLGTLALALALVLLAGASALALAQETRLGGKVRAGESVSVPAGETVRGDLYAFAGTIVVDGTVEGDLIAFGGQVEVNGSVGGDVIAAGGTIALDGRVAGDVRAAGGQVSVGGQVAEDALVASGQLSVLSGGRIGQDLIFSVGQAAIDGPVGGSILGNAGVYERRGTLGGSEDVRIGETTPAPAPAPATTADQAIDAIQHFVAVVLVGGLALWLFPQLLRRAAGALQARPLIALGYGLGACIGAIVLLIAVVVTMIVLAIALGAVRLEPLVALDIVAGLLAIFGGLFAFVVTVAFLVDALVGLTLARIARPWPEGDRWMELAMLAAGAAIVVAATWIPAVGGLVKFLVVLAGLGALALALTDRRPRGAASGAAAPAS